MDEAMLNSAEAMVTFLNLVGSDLIFQSSDHDRFFKWSVIEAGLKCVQGKSIVNSISLKEGETSFKETSQKVLYYGAAPLSWPLMKKGQADTVDKRVSICQRAYKILTERSFAANDIIFDPNISRSPTGIEEHINYAVDYFEATRPDQSCLSRVHDIRWCFQRLLLFPWQ